MNHTNFNSTISQVAWPVVGTFYCNEAEQAKANSLTSGIPLELRPLPSLQYPNAIGVFADNVRVGYVPDKGRSCATCWSHLKPQDKYCKACGDMNIVVGGLATRLTLSGAIKNNFICMVESVNPGSTFEMIMALFVTM